MLCILKYIDVKIGYLKKQSDRQQTLSHSVMMGRVMSYQWMDATVGWRLRIEKKGCLR